MAGNALGVLQMSCFCEGFFFHLEGVRRMFVNKTRGPLAKTMWIQLPTNATCGEGDPQPLSLPEEKNGTFNRVLLQCIQWGTYVWSLVFWVWFFRPQCCDWRNDIDFLASCKIATKFTQRISEDRRCDCVVLNSPPRVSCQVIGGGCIWLLPVGGGGGGEGGGVGLLPGFNIREHLLYCNSLDKFPGLELVLVSLLTLSWLPNADVA